MDLSRVGLAYNSNSFIRMEGQLKTRTDWRDERLSRVIVVVVLTLIRSDFDA